MMNTLLRDAQYGFRMLRRAPGFALVAVLTLALGIGANTAIFTVVNAVMLRMLPVEHPQELVTIGNPARVTSYSTGTPRADVFSYPLYREVRDHNAVFSSLLATSRVDNLQIEIERGTEKVTGRLVTGNYFETLGVKPLIGRAFTAAEDTAPGGDPFIVISYGYWQRRFSGDPSVIGRTVRLRSFPFTIIGVAPPGFFGEAVGIRPDLWAPMMMEPQLSPGRDFLQTPNISSLLMIGRLKPGVTLEQARSNVNTVVKTALQETLASLMEADDRDAMKSAQLRVEVSPGGRGLSRLRAQFSAPLLLLMGLVALVLLVACVNVANLMLARSAARQREIAVRLAIGAAPARIVRQLLTESVLLALLGGLVGLVFANWGSAALVQLANRSNTGSPLVLGLDWRVLGFTAGACLAAGLLFGLAPALRFLHVSLAPALKEGGRDSAGGAHSQRTGRILIGSQVALGVLVLMTAGLLLRSLRNLQELDLGYSRDQLVLARIDPIGSGYKGPAVLGVERELLQRFSRLPGVRSASASMNGLFSGTESADAFIIEGFTPRKSDDSVSNDDMIGPGYFRTIGVPILLGRDISQQDYDSGAPVVVVNERFARFYYGDRNPIGHKVRLQDSSRPNLPPFEIVGVARDVRDHDLREEVPRRIYAPLSTQAFDLVVAPNFEIRAAGNPEALINEVRAAIREFDPNLVIENVETGSRLVNDNLAGEILVARLSTGFGVLVLALILVGLYGVMSYGVVRRTREIGLRMALGARRTNVIWMVGRESCFMLLAGVAAGIPLGLAASTLFKTMLFDVSKADPIAIAGALGALGAICLAAAVIPARRATRVDPMVALRYE
ncbi:MAG: ABC transporter permease [Acidobacteria bacterium]|nr:ABC transporter permease [Acidobacteriota bacterium]